ncbi:MAG: universal stress protein, partial [Mycobacterium sp.]|nr:universal stress protein [Mycobacterium sp.]
GHHRVGSTSVALVGSALCPVAVVRGGGRPAGWVVVELDDTPEAATVLQCGVAQARLRSAPLRVLGAGQSRSGDSHDGTEVTEGDRMVRAQLDRRLSAWRHRYPDLDVAPVAVHGSMLGYVAEHVADLQLVVVGARNATGVGELFGPTGLTALHDTGCSVLVVDPQRLL